MTEIVDGFVEGFDGDGVLLLAIFGGVLAVVVEGLTFDVSFCDTCNSVTYGLTLSAPRTVSRNDTMVRAMAFIVRILFRTFLQTAGCCQIKFCVLVSTSDTSHFSALCYVALSTSVRGQP